MANQRLIIGLILMSGITGKLTFDYFNNTKNLDYRVI